MSPIRPENRDRYPADWTTRIRPAILERATVSTCAGALARCECTGECGRAHEHIHDGSRCPNVNGWRALDGNTAVVVLTIAHLDHTPEHCEPENLRAMCQGCHLRYDADHHAETRAQTQRAARADAGQLTLL
jgi:hypothetical protein